MIHTDGRPTIANDVRLPPNPAFSVAEERAIRKRAAAKRVGFRKRYVEKK